MQQFIPFMGSGPTAQMATMEQMEEMFGAPLSTYTKQQAVEDGILFEAGTLSNRHIVFTVNLLARIEEKATLLAIAIRGLAETARFIQPDLAVFELGGVKVYAHDNGADLTFMLPEDY